MLDQSIFRRSILIGKTRFLHLLDFSGRFDSFLSNLYSIEVRSVVVIHNHLYLKYHCAELDQWSSHA